MNFISKYDVIDLPFKKLYQIIKKNLPAAQSLIYVRQFNALSADDELILGCGENDYHQWEVSLLYFIFINISYYRFFRIERIRMFLE